VTAHGHPDDDPLADAQPADSAPPESLSVRELIGRNLLRMRTDAGIRPDDIARAARAYDLQWTLAWLTGVERGQKPVSAEQLIALPLVLSDALGYKVGLVDLFAGDEPVHLGKDPHSRSQLAAGRIRETLTATPYRRVFSGPDSPLSGQPAANAVSRAAEKMREISRAGLGDLDSRALARAEAGAGDLEDKLARRLAVSPIVVIAAAAGLWGHSATEERAQRLATDVDGEVPQRLRNAVTRKLTTELTERLAEAESAAALAAAEAEAGRLAHEPTQMLPTITPRTPFPRADGDGLGLRETTDGWEVLGPPVVSGPPMVAGPDAVEPWDFDGRRDGGLRDAGPRDAGRPRDGGPRDTGPRHAAGPGRPSTFESHGLEPVSGAGPIELPAVG